MNIFPNELQLLIYYHLHRIDQNIMHKELIHNTANLAVYQYRMYCITDNKYEYLWVNGKKCPTLCPVNAVHTLDFNATTIIKSYYYTNY